MFSESAYSIQVIPMLVLVLLFHIHVKYLLACFITRRLITPRSSRQPPSGIKINVVFHAVLKTLMLSVSQWFLYIFIANDSIQYCAIANTRAIKILSQLVYCCVTIIRIIKHVDLKQELWYVVATSPCNSASN